MIQDAREYVKKCDKLQWHVDVFNAPSIDLHVLISPWPFLQWGLDILGLFTPAQGKLKYLIVVVDYFTKWSK